MLGLTCCSDLDKAPPPAVLGNQSLPESQLPYVQVRVQKLACSRTKEMSTQTCFAEESGTGGTDWASPCEIAEKLLAGLDEEALTTFFRRILAAQPQIASAAFAVLQSSPVSPVSSIQKSNSTVVLSAATGVPKQNLGHTHFHVDSSHDHYHAAPSLIQFSTSIYYAAEEDAAVTIEVLRIGDSSKPCSVSYESVDMSAVANIKYAPISGCLEFGPDEIEKILEVQIINDDTWDTTLDFAVVLSNPSEVAISESLNMCRVKILDNDSFPSNRFRELCKQGRFSEVPRLSQLYEYCKMNMSHRDIRRGSSKIFVFDSIANILVLWDLMLKLYVVDVILVEGEHASGGEHTSGRLSSKTVELVIVAILNLVPEFVILLMDRKRVSLRLGGKARTILQGNILRKFLNYDDSVRVTILESDLIMSVTSDCPAVVNDGFFTCVGLVKDLSLLVLLFFYQLIVAIARADGTDAPVKIGFVVLPTAMFPFIMWAFFTRRERPTTFALLRRDLARNALGRLIEMVVSKVHLILDLSQRNAVIRDCVAGISQANSTQTSVDAINVINKAFAPIFTDFFIAIFLVWGGRIVLDGGMTLGEFLNNLAVYIQMCMCWNNVYNQLLTINSALPAVEQVSRYLNLPIDLNKRREMGNSARECNVTERDAARKYMQMQRQKGMSIASYAIDTVPLKLSEVGFHYLALNYDMTVQGSLAEEAGGRKSQRANDEKGNYTMTRWSSLETTEADMNWSFSIPQGSILALIGKHGDGKSTLLKVIGGVLLPTGGTYFVPPQLRVCFVTHEPLFLQSTLAENLCFGLSAQLKQMPEELDRAKTICRRLGISEHILNAIGSSAHTDWPQLLSVSQLRRLHLARAFIANPEVLVLERPTAGFDLKTTLDIMDLMKEHQRCKGLDIDAKHDAHLRRPRTIVFTTDRPEACTVADMIFLVQRNRVREVDHQDISDEMLYEEWVE